MMGGGVGGVYSGPKGYRIGSVGFGSTQHRIRKPAGAQELRETAPGLAIRTPCNNPSPIANHNTNNKRIIISTIFQVPSSVQDTLSTLSCDNPMW